MSQCNADTAADNPKYSPEEKSAIDQLQKLVDRIDVINDELGEIALTIGDLEVWDAFGVEFASIGHGTTGVQARSRLTQSVAELQVGWISLIRVLKNAKNGRLKK